MNYNIIFISPHLDDAVYSCSQIIREKAIIHNKILIITIFTHYPKSNSTNPFVNGQVRINEDKEICKSLGVDYMHLDYSELMIRNKLSDYSIFNK